MADQFLYMTSTGWKTGNPHRIEIWFVEHSQRYYILSEGGASAHWVQNIAHNPQVSFSVNGRTFEGIARKVDAEKEPELSAAVSKLMSAKYGWSGGLIVELDPLGPRSGKQPAQHKQNVDLGLLTAITVFQSRTRHATAD